MPFSLLSLLLLILPLGLDTLGVSLSLGMKSTARSLVTLRTSDRGLPLWLRTAILFSLAEMLMPILGLLMGAALASLLSGTMHALGALLLIALGAWEFISEAREYLQKLQKRRQQVISPHAPLPQQEVQEPTPSQVAASERFQWGSQLLLALSVSLDELAVGFSFGSLRNLPVDPFALFVGIGLQGFLMTLLGLSLGRSLRLRLRSLKEASELISAALLIGLGIWFLLS